MARICIDLEGTIHNTEDVLVGYKMGRPMPGAVEALKLLRDQGHYIIIFPTWATSPEKVKAIMDWLKYFKIEFDDITSQKPEADVYLDNHGLKFESWAQALSEIQKIKKDEEFLNGTNKKVRDMQ